MIEPDAILALLSRTVKATPIEDGGVRVSTHVLFPSNGNVTVTVRGGEREFCVYDDGAAISEMISAGLRGPVPDRMLRARVRNRGLEVSKGVIRSPTIPLEAIPAAILHVANASRDVAAWAIERLPFRVVRNFRADLAILLDRYFHTALTKDIPIIGASNKPHKFSYVARLSGERTIIVDPVTNEPTSINSRVVANLDVRNMHDPRITQFIVYDDNLRWTTSDLKLLEIGAPTIPFSRVEPQVRQLAH